MRREVLPGAPWTSCWVMDCPDFRRNSGKLQKDYHNYVYERVYFRGQHDGDFLKSGGHGDSSVGNRSGVLTRRDSVIEEFQPSDHWPVSDGRSDGRGLVVLA